MRCESVVSASMSRLIEKMGLCANPRLPLSSQTALLKNVWHHYSQTRVGHPFLGRCRHKIRQIVSLAESEAEHDTAWKVMCLRAVSTCHTYLTAMGQRSLGGLAGGSRPQRLAREIAALRISASL